MRKLIGIVERTVRKVFSKLLRYNEDAAKEECGLGTPCCKMAETLS